MSRRLQVAVVGVTALILVSAGAVLASGEHVAAATAQPARSKPGALPALEAATPPPTV